MNIWEILFCILFFLGTTYTLCWRKPRSGKPLASRSMGLLAMGLLLPLGLLLAFSRHAPHPAVSLKALVPQQVNDKDFVSSTTCQSCHPQQHSSWHNSYHRSMTQLALSDAIVPSEDFDRGLELKTGEITFTLKRNGDEFWVRTPDPDQEYLLLEEGRVDPRKLPHVPPLVDRQIVLATGSHTMQIFWMPSEKENAPLRLFPWIYQIRAQRWMPYEDSFVVHPDFGRPPVSWDNNCIACHTVNGEINPLKQPPDPRIKSTVAEYGISCEACHGPGREHVRKHQNPLTRYQQHFKSPQDRTIVNPAKLTAVMGSQICGQCHSSFDAYEPYQAGQDVNKSRRFVRHADARDPASPFHDNYWNDGSIRIGGREYLGLTESPCYQRGTQRKKMSCFSCHKMHQDPADPRPTKAWADDQLARDMQTNQACLQCHEEMTNRISEHTYHFAQSEGSRCYNCHMPHTSYALLGAIRNHRISSPSVASHLQTGHPNACNLCHLDKSLQWTSEHLTQWYGQPAVELDKAQETVAASVQMLLSGDAVQRIVVAWHMGWKPAWEASGKNWQIPLLAQLLQDPYSAVRFVAHESMKKLPGYQQLQAATEYDFIAPPNKRKQFQDAFLQRWQASKPRAPENPAAILWNEDGTLKAETILKLLQQRDDRKILLAE